MFLCHLSCPLLVLGFKGGGSCPQAPLDPPLWVHQLKWFELLESIVFSDMQCYINNMETCTEVMEIQSVGDWVNLQKEQREQNCWKAFVLFCFEGKLVSNSGCATCLSCTARNTTNRQQCNVFSISNCQAHAIFNWLYFVSQCLKGPNCIFVLKEALSVKVVLYSHIYVSKISSISMDFLVLLGYVFVGSTSFYFSTIFSFVDPWNFWTCMQWKPTQDNLKGKQKWMTRWGASHQSVEPLYLGAAETSFLILQNKTCSSCGQQHDMLTVISLDVCTSVQLGACVWKHVNVVVGQGEHSTLEQKHVWHFVWNMPVCLTHRHSEGQYPDPCFSVRKISAFHIVTKIPHLSFASISIWTITAIFKMWW